MSSNLPHPTIEWIETKVICIYAYSIFHNMVFCTVHICRADLCDDHYAWRDGMLYESQVTYENITDPVSGWYFKK